MSYFAYVVDGVVQQVIVAEQEFIDGLPPASAGVWVETFQDGSQRGYYAGVGFLYDADRDVFFPPQPFKSWVLDASTLVWNPPVAHPGDGAYLWDEQTLKWVSVVEGA